MALQKKPLSVTEIATTIGVEQSNVSHQLKALVSCKIITVEQEGKQRIYSLNTETILPILDIIKKHVQKNCTGCCPKKTDLKNSILKKGGL